MIAVSTFKIAMPTIHVPADAVIFQRRNRLKRHFVNTSNVLLYGYPAISDAAKITYQVIDGFDWESKDTGDSKGYVFPAVETLATIRRTTVRTIQRHIKELEAAKLLTRQRRRYQPSILFIEDVSNEEAQGYLARYVERPQPAQRAGENTKSRNDKNVVSRPHPETTKMSVLHTNKQEEGKEDEINVNVHQQKQTTVRGRVDAIGSILKQYDPVRPRSRVKPDAVAKRDYLAETLADQLNDRKSLGCYRVLAQKIPPSVLLETLAIVKDQRNDGAVHTRPGALFVALIKRYAQQQGIVLGFHAAADLTARSTADLMDSPDPNHPHAALFARLLAAKVPEPVIRQALAEVKADGARDPAKLFTHKMKHYTLHLHKQRLGE